MTPFAIAGLQLEIHADRPNLDHVRSKIELCMHLFPWVQMVVVSELATYGPLLANAQALPGQAEEAYQRLAEKHRIWLLPGSVYERAAGPRGEPVIYNTAPVINPRGEVIARYRKMFPFLPYETGVEWGTEFCVFDVPDVGRFGVSICYEAIVPSFYRKVMANKVNVAVNLTNDSWFGVTAEPYQHGALAVFRAVESRVPLIRVTNTGTSFSVDTLGRIGEQTGVYQEGVQNQTIYYSEVPPLTPYIRFGDWFAWSLGVILVAFLIWVWRNDASLSH